jgi:LacI family transcriptional regulator
MALGASRALEEQSIQIPQDVSLIGFDDIPEAGFFRPPLSTVKQDFAALGQLSIQYLMAEINPSTAILPSRFIQPFVIHRQSSAAPTKRNGASRS